MHIFVVNNFTMFRNTIGWLVFTLALGFMASCNGCKDKPTVEEGQGIIQVVFQPRWGNEPFVMQQEYFDSYGTRFRCDRFQQYVSMMTLLDDQGGSVRLQDFILLNFLNPNEFSFAIPAANYTSLQLGLGVPREYNKNQDPTQYPSSHALSIQGNQGMFWTWNSGYIFSKFEGKCDTSSTGQGDLLIPIAIHAGNDTCYREVSLQGLGFNLPRGEERTLYINFDVQKILTNSEGGAIDIAVDGVTHTTTNERLALTYSDNLATSLSAHQ